MKKESKLLSTSKACRVLGICQATIRTWADEGKIKTVRTAGGHRRYDVDDFNLQEHLPRPNVIDNLSSKREATTSQEKGAIYCRVSSHKQQDDLHRQIQYMQQAYPDYQVYQDICSGLKYKRKGLTRLLVDLEKGDIKHVVVAHKDRLARFGVELIEWFISRAGARLVVLDESVLPPNEELVSDLMVHVFSCRANGKRRYKRSVSQGADDAVKVVQEQKRRRTKDHPSGPGCTKRTSDSNAVQTC